jgi:hypothetical protein
VAIVLKPSPGIEIEVTHFQLIIYDFGNNEKK